VTEPRPSESYTIEGTWILALDASTKKVGWCFARNNKYVGSGTFKPEGKDAWGRIAQIGMWVYAHCESLEPGVVAVEEPTGGHGNARTDRLLGGVVGAIRLACKLRAVPFVLINAMKVKATEFDKNHRREAALLAGKDEVGGDEADAIGVWQALIAECGWFGRVSDV
jgi:Holliday junction resolvasome RuvABC endonuclease subunit